jgi:anti-sigma-K factor RskA
MQRFVLILIVCVTSRVTDQIAFAQCASGGGGMGSALSGFGGLQAGLDPYAQAQARIERRFAMCASQIRQTAQRQGAAAKARFRRYVAAKNAYRSRVLAEAAMLSKQPRFSRKEQLRQKLLERNKQRQRDRIMRDARQLLAQRTYNGR